MKQIQKRYFYGCFLGSLFFIVCYGVLDFNLLIVLPLTIITFIGSSLFFKDKDVRKYDPKLIQNYYFGISKIANYANRIKDITIKEQIQEITSLTDQILIKIAERPHKVEQVYDFCDYYLDITYKILRQYNAIINRTEKTPKEKEFEKKIKTYMSALVKLFEKQNKNMNDETMLDINSEIKVFEKTLGLDKMNTLMEVGEEDGHK